MTICSLFELAIYSMLSQSVALKLSPHCSKCLANTRLLAFWLLRIYSPTLSLSLSASLSLFICHLAGHVSLSRQMPHDCPDSAGKAQNTSPISFVDRRVFLIAPTNVPPPHPSASSPPPPLRFSSVFRVQFVVSVELVSGLEDARRLSILPPPLATEIYCQHAARDLG